MRRANLCGVNFSILDLREAKLQKANLVGARLGKAIRTDRDLWDDARWGE